MKPVFLSAALVAAGSFVTNSYGASLVTNGSFENTAGTFVNTAANYMALSASSTAIPGWTVAPGTVSDIVWGVNPTDGFTASNGAAFVDLSGFGSNSPNGSVQQSLSTVPGLQYTFSYDFSGVLSNVSIGTLPLTLTLGPGFNVAGTQWTNAHATFIAPAGSQLLSILNGAPGEQIVFIDNVSVELVTPLPAALPLFVTGLAGLGWLARRRRRQAA